MGNGLGCTQSTLSHLIGRLGQPIMQLLDAIPETPLALNPKP